MVIFTVLPLFQTGGILLLFILIVLILILIKPRNITNISSYPQPVHDYAQALERIEQLRMVEPAEVSSVCRLKLMTHDKAVERAIILVHGYTNCPQQFGELGRRFYALGYNVLIARLPHHGLSDRMSEDHGQLKAEELASYTDETVDIAHGLGEHMTMMGFSAGGVVAAWAAQNRDDLDLAVIISPDFGIRQVPSRLTAAAMNIILLLPDAFTWWDPNLKEGVPPTYAYARYSRHAVAQTLRLAFATRAKAVIDPPGAKKMVVVFNANDHAVNNAVTMEVVKLWQAHGANLSTYKFDSSLKLGHDLIDPNQPDQQVDIVYPRLIDLVNM